MSVGIQTDSTRLNSCRFMYITDWIPVCILSARGTAKYIIYEQSMYMVLYNQVFNCFKQHVYYVSINSFIYNVSKNNFLECSTCLQ